MSSGKLVGSGVLSSSGARSSIGLDHGGIMSPGAGRIRKKDHIEFLFDCHYKQNHDVDDFCRGSILESGQVNDCSWTGTYKSFAVSIGGL